MRMLISLAWRNLFRNSRRTLLTAIVIGVGLACLMFQEGLIEGTLRSMLKPLDKVNTL